jgi:hypothetical protein
MSRVYSPILRILVVVVIYAPLIGWSPAQGLGDALEQGFKQPPDSAKPRVWWHWMNGNVTKEGITADLEWMKRVGIAGMQMFDGNLGTPQFVDNRLVWMTPDWKDALRHAAAEADRLSLEMAMAASGGWSETGGPSVKPAQAMKKIVWSQTYLQGPRKFSGRLTPPPSVNGLFQNIARPESFTFPTESSLPGAKPMAETPPPQPDPTYYADIKVVAYRVPDGEVRMADLHPKVTTSVGNIDAAVLMDGDVGKTIDIPFTNGAKQAWIQFEFARPYGTWAFSFAGSGGGQFGDPGIPNGLVQASQDGIIWVTLLSLPGPGHPSASSPVATYSFPETTARFFRLVMDPPKPGLLIQLFGGPTANSIHVAEIEFASTPRVNRWEAKAQFANMLEFESAATPSIPADQIIPLSKVIDLTPNVSKDGALNWDVPSGKWMVLRMGYSLTGQKNGPASPEATGFEVDKLSRKSVDAYLQDYVGQIASTLGPYFGKSFRYFLMDSWEAGLENWTEDMIGEFKRRRGYDLTPYLPVLTGRIVGSADVSDRFLWDFRRTIADLLAENHYGAAAQYLEKRGIGLYAEAMGTGSPTTGDGLQNKGQVAIPMGEFWLHDSPDYSSDMREAASAAHIYGKNIAAAESFTSMPAFPMWGQSPFDLKPRADRAFSFGINRIVFHESAAQPFVDDRHKPGMTLGVFGQNYTRNITWAEQAVAWNEYLARCSYMLQQGRFVGDLVYFYGEGSPVTVPFWKEMKQAPPPGYDYDYTNTEVLMQMSVRDDRIVLPNGMSYRVLVLPEDVNRLTLPLVLKLRDLVAAGATVIAQRPGNSPSLAGFPNDDGDIRKIADEVWGGIDGKSITENGYGKGRVYWGKPIQEVLALAKTPPDFEYNRPDIDTNLMWIHRRSSEADIYFVSNRWDRAEQVKVRFRMDGKEPELWHPDTGIIETAEYRSENGLTTVPLQLDPFGSVFVVFRRAAVAPSRTLPKSVSTVLTTLRGPWNVNFPPNCGAPPQIKLDTLTSWTASSDAGVKYFSGTATYSTEVEMPPEWFGSGAKLLMNLGRVREIAELTINGQPAGGILWKPPFQADVTHALKPGTNRLEIKITNLWPNRIIGDLQFGTEKKFTFTDYRPYKADSPLLESGLMGPVTIRSVRLAERDSGGVVD